MTTAPLATASLWTGTTLSAWATTSHLRAAIVLVLLCLSLFLPGYTTLPPMDRDEPRFSQATRQMLESGDFIDIRFQDEARHKKPVGIYWLQSASVALGEAVGVPDARRQVWLYRIPSLLGAIGAVLLSYWAALAFMPRGPALLAAVLLASTVLLGVEARLAKTDAAMCLTVVAALGVLGRLWIARHAPRTPSIWLAVAFWVAIGAGVLIKGPITPMVAGLTALALSVHARSGAWLAPLRPLLGLAIVLLMVAPWFAAIMVKSGGTFLADSVGEDMLAKVRTGQESHGAPPGVFLLAALGTAWPLIPFAIIAVPAIWRARREDGTAFLLAWLIPSWIVFELTPTKLPHYVLPLYPAVALLVGLAIARDALRPDGTWRKAVIWLLPLLPALLAGAVLVAGLRFEGIPPFYGPPALLAGAIVAAYAAVRFVRGQIEHSVCLAAIAAVIVAFGAYMASIPGLRSFQLSPRLMATLTSSQCPDPLLATAGYREPSLVLLTRTDLEMTDGAGAADFLSRGGCRMAFVESRLAAMFERRITELAVAPRLVTRVRGVNLNGGRALDIAVYAVAP